MTTYSNPLVRLHHASERRQGALPLALSLSLVVSDRRQTVVDSSTRSGSRLRNEKLVNTLARWRLGRLLSASAGPPKCPLSRIRPRYKRTGQTNTPILFRENRSPRDQIKRHRSRNRQERHKHTNSNMKVSGRYFVEEPLKAPSRRRRHHHQQPLEPANRPSYKC